jgi:thiosulfate dehydrogenase
MKGLHPNWINLRRTLRRRKELHSIVATLLLAASALLLTGYTSADQEQASTSPTMSSSQLAVPADDQSPLVRQGRQIFDETPRYAPSYTGAKVSCGDCHVNSGTEPYAAPMVDLAGQFPMYSKRAGRMISLQERIQECFLRSENGRPLPSGAPEMEALVAYINWLSRNDEKGEPYKGRGLVKLAALTGNAARGKQEYASQCAACHGEEGAGFPPALPPVWGPASYNDGAGIDRPENMAAFLFHNMPKNHPGALTAQQSFDIAVFLHTKPRPRFNQAYQQY